MIFGSYGGGHYYFFYPWTISSVNIFSNIRISFTFCTNRFHSKNQKLAKIYTANIDTCKVSAIDTGREWIACRLEILWHFLSATNAYQS